VDEHAYFPFRADPGLPFLQQRGRIAWQRPDQAEGLQRDQADAASIDARIRSHESYRFGLKSARARMAAWEAIRKLISEKERRFSSETTAGR
jgi:cytochrome oxidase assembly protein ShyY1